MQAAQSEILAWLMRNGYSDEICFLGGGLLFWGCSGVYTSKVVRVPRDIWDNGSGQSNFSAEAGAELQHQVHRGLGLSLQK